MAGRGYRTLKPYETSKSSLNNYLQYTEEDFIFPLIYIQLNMRIVHVTYLHGRFQIFWESPCFWEIQNSTIISAIYPSIQSPCATVPCRQWLERWWKHSRKIFCERKPFQLFSRIPNDVSSSQKRCLFRVISFEGTGTNQLDQSQESVGDSPVLSLFYFLRNPWLKPTGVLEHCC